MRNKLMAVVLSCLTFLTLFVSALVPMQASAVSVDEMTRAAVSIITSNEGTYGSVNRNDCGAVSVGMLQWHANRALQLMPCHRRGRPRFCTEHSGRHVLSGGHHGFRLELPHLLRFGGQRSFCTAQLRNRRGKAGCAGLQ